MIYHYLAADQGFHFPRPIPELEPFAKHAADKESAPFIPYSFSQNEYQKITSLTEGWAAGAQRIVEVYDTENGILLKIEGCGDFFIAPHGEMIGKRNPQEDLSPADREIILGPALVLALALRGIWSLHASAAMYNENIVVFLGESGMGKSTLAAYLAKNTGWRLVADDILPVKMDANQVTVLPHFPQLKLPIDAQPGIHFPERLPLRTICVLEHAEAGEMPDLQKISTAQTVQILLGHIAGTRMFNPALLAKHLEFSTQAAKQISAYRLTHPHRRDTLPLVKEFLEKIC